LAEEIQRLINIDSSVFIEYFRKVKKENSFFFKLLQKDFHGFVASIIVHFEIYKGVTPQQLTYWNNLFEDILLIPYTQQINNESLLIHAQLKSNRKSIELQDLMIAATAKSLKIPLATLNKKHYIDIEGIDLITPDDL
jgi:tRNA(fMet)-specific endonuclease VapC